MTYPEYVCDYIRRCKAGNPIYTAQIATCLKQEYDLLEKDALAATAVAVKRILDGKMIPDLRFYQKGIYFRTVATPFGELGINKELLIQDKYLLPDIGYETGFFVLHQMGLTSQMPRERVLATNKMKDCTRSDKKLGVVIRPPRVQITAKNKAYLQLLDALELLDKAPIDVEKPYTIIADYIQKNDLRYDELLAFADRYYGKNAILQLAHVASERGDAR